MTRLCFVLVFLIFCRGICAQNQLHNTKLSVPDSLSVSANVHQSLVLGSHSLLKSAILPVSLITAGIIIESLPPNTVFSKKRIQEHVQDQMNGFSPPWISVCGYVCAATTGYLRVANNRHWASDVLVGAGIGIVSVKVVYLTHRYRLGKKQAGILIPTLFQNGGEVALAMRF